MLTDINWLQVAISCAVGAVVSLALREWWDNRKSTKRELLAKSFGFGGRWIDEIYNPDGSIRAKDVFLIEQYSSDLKGTIERHFCEDTSQIGKRWDFVGRVRENAIIAVFWEIAETGSSYGCLHVQRTSAGIYEGNYISADSLRQFLNSQSAEHFSPPRIRLTKP